MTPQISVEATFGPDGILSKKLANYRERPQQIALSEQIDSAFTNGLFLVAEAPTGVGKSFAALVPAFDKIINEEARILVVTSSIVLQNQYMEKEIPFLEKLYEKEVSPILIKGKNNYVCPKKIAMGGTSVHPSRSGQFDHVKRWSRETRTGSFSELPFQLSSDVRKATSIVAEGECKGKRCPLYESCFYYQNKRKLSKAKIVVCNYHYLFTSIQSGDFNSMLGGDFDYVIYDEGHEIMNIARDFSQKIIKRSSLDNHMARLLSFVEIIKKADHTLGLADGFNKIEYPHWKASLNDKFDGLLRLMVQLNDSKHDYLFYDGSRRIKEAMQDLLDQHTKLANALDEYRRETFPEDYQQRNDFPDYLNDYFHEVDQLLAQVNTLRAGLMMVLAEEDGYISWIEPKSGANDVPDCQIICKPFDPSGEIEELFSRFDGGVIMSATMAVGGDLDYFANQLGVPEDLRIDFITETPFDLSNNLVWYLPAGHPEGTERTHADMTVTEMYKVASVLQGRTLCLFTSNRNLQLATDYFKNHPIPNVRVMSQKNFQKERIIEDMRTNEDIIVLATRSFFTGVDIQGRALSAVLIDKIPFPMTGDPLNSFLSDQHNGFNRFMLPESIITMKQAVGRLNRTETDRGLVAVFDGRLRTKNYKQRIFKSFGFTVRGMSNFEDVEAFLREL